MSDLDTTMLNFTPSREDLEALSQPTHLLISGYLRKSATFRLYAAAMAELGITGAYLPYELPRTNGKPDIEGLREIVNIFRVSTEIETMMISDPYKREIVGCLDGLEPRARQSGSANLVFKRGYTMVGDNLDGEAFLMSAEEELKHHFQGSRMVFFGCGGVSSAVATKLAPKLSRVALVEPVTGKAVRLRERLLALAPKLEVEVLKRSGPLDLREYDVLYNGSGLGKMSQEVGAEFLSPLLPEDLLPNSGLAIDANYSPWETTFLRRLKERGLTTYNGFSHMVGSTTLHLAFIAGRTISYRTVRYFAEQIASEAS